MNQGSEPQETAVNSAQSKIIDKAIDVIKFMGQSKLAELELTTNELKIKLKRYSGAGAPAFKPQPVLPSSNISDISDASNVMPSFQVKEVKETAEANLQYTGCTKIISPIGGTFYAAPSPDTEPFVKVGSVVKSGDLLCYIEAMKLMNEIKSNASGKVVKIMAKNAEPVKKGEVIMLIGE